MKKPHLPSWIAPILSIAFWVGLWWIVALYLGKPLLLPTPCRVLCKLVSLATTTTFWSAVAASLLRVTGGILTALLLGTLLALLTTRIRLLHHLFTPLLSLCKATPVTAVIFLLLLFLGRRSIPFFIALAVATPIVWGSVREGIVSADRQLLEMAEIFALSPRQVLWRIHLPLLLPYFKAACLSAIGLAFKAGIAAEILCLPQISLGTLLYESRLYLQTEDLFAYTLCVVLISAIIEKITLRLLSGTQEKESRNA